MHKWKTYSYVSWYVCISHWYWNAWFWWEMIIFYLLTPSPLLLQIAFTWENCLYHIENIVSPLKTYRWEIMNEHWSKLLFRKLSQMVSKFHEFFLKTFTVTDFALPTVTDKAIPLSSNLQLMNLLTYHKTTFTFLMILCPMIVLPRQNRSNDGFCVV